MSNTSYYAVFRGKVPGIFTTWDECKHSVLGTKGAVYKKFSNLQEAEQFMKEGVYTTKKGVNTNTKPKYIHDPPGSYIVYTDGSCDLINHAAGAGVYFGKDNPRNLSECVPGEQTSQRAELWAIKLALSVTNGSYTICTDSKYSINVLEKTWVANANLDIISQIWDHMKGRKIIFYYTPAHVGIPGNEQADRLAYKAMQLFRNSLVLNN